MPTDAKTKKWRPWEPNDPVRVIVFGKFKAGKTFGAGTFPRPCFMDFDRGMGTLYSPDFLKKYGYREFEHREFYETDYKGPIVRAHNAYDDACKYFDEMMSPANRDKFDTWVIDSATTLGEDAQNKAVILLGTQEYNKMSGTHAQALKYGMLVPKIQDYGAERSLVEQFVDMLLSTDKHVVLTCHEKEQRDKEGNLLAILPLLTGKSDQAVPLRFDEVYNVQAKKGETKYDKDTHMVTQDWLRVLKTTTDGTLIVGSRNGVPDGTPWNYESVFKALEAAYKMRLEYMKAAANPTDKAAAAPAV